jgi:hypothetical protein
MEKLCVIKLLVVYFLNLGIVEPFNTLAVLPQTILQLAVFRHDVGTQPMLLALIPEAFITATIRPCVNAEPMIFIILILALIHAAVVPNVYSHPLHIVIKPFAFVASAVEP